MRHLIKTENNGFRCTCGEFFETLKSDDTDERVATVAQAAHRHADYQNQLDKTQEQLKAQPDHVENKEHVNHPNHYGGDTVYETIKVLKAWGLGFLLGNCVKYISRAGKKDASKLVEDLKKGRFYLDYAIKLLENGESLF